MASSEPYYQEIEDNKINERIEAQLQQESNRQQAVVVSEESSDSSQQISAQLEEEPCTTEPLRTGTIPKRGFSYLANASLGAQNNLNNRPVLRRVKPTPRNRNSEKESTVKHLSTVSDFKDGYFIRPRCLSNQSIFENTNKSVVGSDILDDNRSSENHNDFRRTLQQEIEQKLFNKPVSKGVQSSREKSGPSSLNKENLSHDISTNSLEGKKDIKSTSGSINRNGSLMRACQVLRSNLEKQKYLQSSEKASKSSENIEENKVNSQEVIQNRVVPTNASKLEQRNAKIMHTQLVLKGLVENNIGFQSAIQPDLRHGTSAVRDSENQTKSSVPVSDQEEEKTVKVSCASNPQKGSESRIQPLSTVKNEEKNTSIHQNPQLSRNLSKDITLENDSGILSENKTPSASASTTEIPSKDENKNPHPKTKNFPNESIIKNTPGKLKPEAFSFLSKLPKTGNDRTNDGRKSLVPTVFIHAGISNLAPVRDENSEVQYKTEDFPLPSAPPYPSDDYSELELSHCQKDNESGFKNQGDSKVSQESSTSDDETRKPALPSRPPPAFPDGCFSSNIKNKKKSSSYPSLTEKKLVNPTVNKKEVKKSTGLRLSTNLTSKPLPPEPNSDEPNSFSVPKLTPPPLPPFPLKLVNKSQYRFSRDFSPTLEELEESNLPVQVAGEANCAETQKERPLYPSFEAILAVEKNDAVIVTNRASNKDLIELPPNIIHAEDSEGYLLDTGKDFIRQSPPTVPPRKTSQPCTANTKLDGSPSGESPRPSPNSDLNSWMNSIDRPCLPQKLKTTQRSLSCNSLVQSFREMSFAMWNPPPKEKRISMDSYQGNKPSRSISKESITKVQPSTANVAFKEEVPEAPLQRIEISLPGFADSKSQLSRYPWYHDIDAREGQRRLKDFLDQNGAFLIRPSSKKTNEIQHTASMVYSGRIINMHIRQKPNGQYALGFERAGEPTFSSICELINYYQDVPIESTGQSNSVKSFRACFRVTPPKS